jgi:hypothetical protein
VDVYAGGGSLEGTVKALKPARAGRRVAGLGLRRAERSAGREDEAGSSTGEMGETGETGALGLLTSSRSSAEFQELREEEVERLLFLRRREAFREENMPDDEGEGVERSLIPGTGNGLLDRRGIG